MQVRAYLFFNGRCDEALEFYRQKLGAAIGQIMRFGDSPEPHRPGALPPGHDRKIMHASFTLGETTVWASDGSSAGGPQFEGFALSLLAADVSEAERIFAALGDGGAVAAPLTKTFFSERFGMVRDRFGVLWMVMVM